MKEYFDQIHKAKSPQIRIGSKVLLRQGQARKSDTFWDPKPLVVTEINGPMVTAERDDKRVTRNSSFFKLVVDYLEDEVNEEASSSVVPNYGSRKEIYAPSSQGDQNGQLGSGDEVERVADKEVGVGRDQVRPKQGRPSREETESRRRRMITEKAEYEERRRQDQNIRVSSRLQGQHQKKNGGGCNVETSQHL